MKRRIMWSVALALAAGALVWSWLGGGGQSMSLADGTRLTLRGVQVGTNCTFDFGNPLQRAVSRLPWKWVKKFGGGRTATHLSQETNLVVWFTASQKSDRIGTTRFRFVQEDGTNWLERRFSFIHTATHPEISMWRCYTDFWPRRARLFTLQALDATASPEAKPLWEFQVRNPDEREYPQWQPEVLPGRRKVVDTVFTLESISDAPNLLERGMTEAKAGGLLTRSVLRMTTAGQPDDDWEVVGSQFRDATGNRLQWIGRWIDRRKSGERGVEMLCPLLAGEEAGKLGVALVRVKGMDTNDVLVIRGVPLIRSSPGSPGMPFRTNTSFGEVYVSVYPSNAGEDFSLSVYSRAPLLRDIAAPGARWFLPLHARDDLGRVHSLLNSPLDLSNLQRVSVPAGAKSVDLAVAAARVVFVEFTIGRETILREPQGRK